MKTDFNQLEPTMQNLYRNLDLEALARKINTFSINLQDYEMVSPTLARVVLAYSGTPPMRQEILASITETFKGLAVPVHDSFRTVEQAGDSKTVVGFVRSARETRPMSDIPKDRQKQMASNLLMDTADKSLWEVRSSGKGEGYLVRQGEENLEELVHLAHAPRAALPTLASIATFQSTPREFAAFVDPTLEEVQHGFVVKAFVDPETRKETLEVIARGSEASVTIPANMLVAVANLEGEDATLLGTPMAAEVAADKSALVEYYKKAYPYSPEYVQKIIDMINQHAFA